jgi:radical SAM superfamily enzyme YgiQ (UPF0313 family)
MLDVLFVHAGSESVPRILVMPMGLLVLADLLDKNGHKTQIINHSIEKKVDSQFDIINYLNKTKPRLVCLSLHWHQQSPAVIKLVKHIKKHQPKILIAVGGFTASFYHEEIIRDFPEIDFIIRGDGETPLLQLANCLFNNLNFHRVPNLTWRENNKAVINNHSYVVSPKIFNNLNFANFSLVKNRELCFLHELLDTKLDLTTLKNNNYPKNPVFFFNCGRGCLVNCSYCGGGACAQKSINNREGIILMNLDDAIRQLKTAHGYGVNWWFTDFFPGKTDKYYIELFKKIRKEELALRCSFSCWHLPSREFIEEFSKTFISGSELEISPDTGSEKVRNQNKGYTFTNNDLLATLSQINQAGTNCSVHFAPGLPHETVEDKQETDNLVSIIQKLFSRFEIVFSLIEVEPASPWQEGPKYKKEHNKKYFVNFLKLSCGICAKLTLDIEIHSY